MATPVCVCVPARDEAETLPQLFEALRRQTGAPPFTLCLFLDGDADAAQRCARERAEAAGLRLAVRTGPAGAAPNAGRARRAALELGQTRLCEGGALLTTDADSTPAPDWVAAACRALEVADLVAGRIVREGGSGAWADPAHAAQSRLEAYYDRLYRHRRRLDPVSWEAGDVHHHTGGANLAIRADAYAALGGFEPVASGEDARLVDAAQRAGFRVRRDPAMVVHTSSRTTGRAPDGLASALRRWSQGAAPEAVQVAHPADEAWRYARHAAARAAFAPDLSAPAAAVLAGLWGGCGEDLRRAAAAAPNAEAFATRVVPTAPGARLATLPDAERALARLERELERAARVTDASDLLAPLRVRVAALEGDVDPPNAPHLHRLLAGLYAAGREDLPLGRLFEGHVDAMQIVTRLGSAGQVAAAREAVRAGGLLGVWNADLPGEPLRLEGERLTGGKAYASGAGVLTHALVTADVPVEAGAGGRQLLLLDLARTPPAIDREWWRTLGMQRSQTHLVRWADARVGEAERLGAPGDYVREPWFTGGALRFAAVQAGGVAGLFDRARDHLLRLDRAGDPLQAARLAELYGCAQAAADAVRRAGEAAFDAEEARRLAHVAAARVRVAEAAERALALAQQAVGLPGLFLAHPLAAAVADLTVYLRQPGPDAQRLRVGAACAAGTLETAAVRLRLRRPRAALIVAPHPDDEVIGAFGLMRALKARGVRVRVLVVADGAASHPGSARWPKARLTLQRARESRWALRRLGLPAGAVRTLGLPDGGLERRPAELARAIGREVRRVRGLSLLIGPTPDDDHADHRAVAAALARARTLARRLAYPVWPAGAPGRRLRTLPVPGGVAAKRAAMRVYRTQTGAITDDPQGFALSRGQIAAFTRGVERFVELAR